MKLRSVAAALFVLLALVSSGPAAAPGGARAPGSANPVIPGYYADPSIVSYQGKYYVYATLDPWGGETLGCWESDDFADWTFRPLNWPTKAACKSPTSRDAGVWAPSVVLGPDGRFHLYVSVGNEVWAGVADHPLGPWRNALGDRPLIPGDFRPGYHMIDAEAFVDDDGVAYLYWGSGWNWVNGRCWAVRLKPDMVTFDGEVRDVTPAHYFEAPFVFKRGGRYFLTYSNGRTDRDTYQVHYAVGETPFGPFTEAANSPILVTDKADDVVSPGHHAVFARDGRDYILYHRHSVPHDPKFIGRQICVDELRLGPDGLLEKVTPTHAGPAWLHDRRARRGGLPNLATAESGASAGASGQVSADHAPALVLDDNYATWWAPSSTEGPAWLALDLGSERAISIQEIRLEYPWKPLRYIVESSLDGQVWTRLASSEGDAPVGSPVLIEKATRARHLRLTFPDPAPLRKQAVIEWRVF